MSAQDVENAIKKVEEYKTSVKEEAETLVKKVFPCRVVELNTLLETATFDSSNLSRLHADLKIPIPDPGAGPPECNSLQDGPVVKKRKLEANCADITKDVLGSKVYLLPCGTVPHNSNVGQVIELVKPHIRRLVEDANALKMWICFLIPKIEDGNNFGVSIQEDTLAEIRTVESEGAAFYDQISRYFMTRAKLVSKVAKYPHIDDYRKAVIELDEKEFLSLRLALWEVRNHYASMHDLIVKNMDKIKKPRSANHDTLY